MNLETIKYRTKDIQEQTDNEIRLILEHNLLREFVIDLALEGNKEAKEFCSIVKMKLTYK